MPQVVIGLQRTFLIDVNDSIIVADENFVQMAQQSGGSFTRAMNKVDTTNKQDAGFTSEIGVTKTWSISVEGFDTPDNVALRHLTQRWQSTAFTDVEIHIMFFLETGEQLVGFGSFDSFEISVGTNEAVPYTFSLTGRGPISSRSGD